VSARAGGLTLIEVLMGTVIVSLVVVSASWALSQAGSNKHVHEESPINAALLAKEIHELALTLPTADSGKAAATAPGEVVALDTLDGAEFSPPVSSALEELGGSKGWMQRVKVSVYDLTDLETPVSDDFTSEAKSSSSLYKLTVTVFDGKTEMGDWSWWINP
jgi:hypothetical protein